MPARGSTGLIYRTCWGFQPHRGLGNPTLPFCRVECWLSCHYEESEVSAAKAQERPGPSWGRSRSAEDSQGRLDQLHDKRRQRPREVDLMTTNCSLLSRPAKGHREGDRCQARGQHTEMQGGTSSVLLKDVSVWGFPLKLGPLKKEQSQFLMPHPPNFSKAQLSGAGAVEGYCSPWVWTRG